MCIFSGGSLGFEVRIPRTVTYWLYTCGQYIVLNSKSSRYIGYFNPTALFQESNKGYSLKCFVCGRSPYTGINSSFIIVVIVIIMFLQIIIATYSPLICFESLPN